MKVALVHDYIKEYGGAERVLEVLHEMFPEAPVYTLVYCPEFLGPHKDRFASWDIRPSFLQHVPLKHKCISIFRLIAPSIFKAFDVSSYDLIIVSATGAYAPNMIGTKKTHTPSAIRHKPVHLCYCHTPPRYLYGYATARDWKNNVLLRIVGEIANHFLRIVDYTSSKNVDVFIANSENVAQRIKKFYRRDAVVIYPPAISPSPALHAPSPSGRGVRGEGYYLAGGRLARAKHYDLIMKACAEIGVPLKIFGKGFAGYEEDLKSQISIYSQNSGRDISLLGEVSDEEKMQLMAGARAFIFAGEDEDFGIVPVEAMSVGTPVIAYKSGGVLETIIEGKTGVFFDKLSSESLVAALKKFSTYKIKSEDCVHQAEKFSKRKFQVSINEIISKVKVKSSK